MAPVMAWMSMFDPGDRSAHVSGREKMCSLVSVYSKTSEQQLVESIECKTLRSEQCLQQVSLV